MNKVALVSEGKEIAFTKVLSDLFVMKSEDQVFYSTLGSLLEVEMYSKQTLLHTSISKKTFKIFVGTVAKEYTDGNLIYEEAGMCCSVGTDSASLYVDEKVAASKSDVIMKKLRELEDEYFEKEQEFVRSTNKLKVSADTRTKTSFFVKKNVSVMQNAYLCLAYYFYLYILPLQKGIKSI